MGTPDAVKNISGDAKEPPLHLEGLLVPLDGGGMGTSVISPTVAGVRIWIGDGLGGKG